LGLACAPGALAAVPDAEPPPIIVTAPSGSDTITLTDSPVNVAVLSGEALARQHHADLADALDSALGSVSLSNGTGSPYQSDLAYRGFAASSLPGSATGLSVWLDGVRMNEPFGSIVNWDLIPVGAIAGVEVLPGANPLFGLNTLGGALVLTTKNGASHGGLGLTVQGGSFGRRAVLGEAGGTFADKNLDWFVLGNFDDQNGYRQYSPSRVGQGYGKLRWRGSVSHAELGVIWADTALHGTQSLPPELLGTPQVAYTWPDAVANRALVINLKADSRLSGAVRISGNVYFRRSNSQSVNSNASLGDACTGGAFACTALAPGGTAIDLFAQNPFAGQADYGGGLPIHDFTGAINTTLIASRTAQTTFGGNGLIDVDTTVAGLVNDLNLGGSFESAQVTYGQTTSLGQLIATQVVAQPWNLLYGNSAGFRGSPLINAVAVASHNQAANLFVRDLLKLTARLSVTASLSYTRTQISLAGTSTTTLDPAGRFAWTGADGALYYNRSYLGAQTWDARSGTLVAVAAPPGSVPGPEIAPVSGGHVYHRFDPAIGLAWNPATQIGLFANYGEAMRAPTAIELACADPARPCALPTGFNGDPALAAVVAQSLEAGLRGAVGRHVTVNAAVYRTRVANDIQFIYTPSGLGYFANLGRTVRQGFELGLSADWAGLHLSASYGHVVATYRDSFVDANGDKVAPGNRISGIPAQAFKLRATWQATRTLALGANLVATAGQYAHGDEANTNPAVPGYAVVHADVQFAPSPRLVLFARVTNLFDVHYATFGVLGGDIYTGTGAQFRTPAAGRALLGGVTYQLGKRHRGDG
jgi:outer membrane receptor protein involved in Fe transport